MTINTIGFAGKTTEQFFTILVKNNVKKLIDIRLNNKSQLSGFANVYSSLQKLPQFHLKSPHFSVNLFQPLISFF